MRFAVLAFALLLSLSLTGCDEEDCWLCWGEPNQGRLSLGVTATSMDHTTEAVVLSLTGVALQNAAGDWKRFDFVPPKQINLLPEQDQSQGLNALLLDREQLENGRYQAIQLFTETYPDNITDTYVLFSGPTHQQYSLELSKALILTSSFDMPRHGTLELMIDFDLHRGLRQPDILAPLPEALELTPYMRLAQVQKSGSFKGTVDAGLTNNPSCIQSDGLFAGFVYAFRGSNINVANALSNGNFPIASAPVFTSGDFNHMSNRYELLFLPEDNYTLAYVCEEEDYIPYSRNNLHILRNKSVSVDAERTEQVDFF